MRPNLLFTRLNGSLGPASTAILSFTDEKLPFGSIPELEPENLQNHQRSADRQLPARLRLIRANRSWLPTIDHWTITIVNALNRENKFSFCN